MDKPVMKLKDAVQHLRTWANDEKFPNLAESIRVVLPHVVEWPAELTRERLEELARNDGPADLDIARDDALHALAAIAPERKKRVVELWIHERGQKEWLYSDDKWTAQRATMPGWECIKRNVELED